MIAFVVLDLNMRLRGLRPRGTAEQVVENSDFRKFDDILRMTLDCSAGVADRIGKASGSRAEAKGSRASACIVSRRRS